MTDEERYFEPGDPCPLDGCDGTLREGQIENCSCHISAPCSACENSGCECDTCDFDSAADWKDERRRERLAEIDRQSSRKSWRHGGPDRTKETTRTHVANPFNSTPFTDCCGVASFGSRCEMCNAEIIGHDDGLAARRREVGAGNCLMCGKPRDVCYC